jgi:hypothetical protein
MYHRCGYGTIIGSINRLHMPTRRSMIPLWLLSYIIPILSIPMSMTSVKSGFGMFLFMATIPVIVGAIIGVLKGDNRFFHLKNRKTSGITLAAAFILLVMAAAFTGETKPAQSLGQPVIKANAGSIFRYSANPYTDRSNCITTNDPTGELNSSGQ